MGWLKGTGRPWYILNRLRYKYQLPHSYYTILLWFLWGVWKRFSPIRKVGKREQLLFLYHPLSCDLLLEWSTYQKDNEAEKIFLWHHWPKWEHVKDHQLPNLDRVPFWTGWMDNLNWMNEWTGLMCTPVNYTIGFLLPSRLKRGASQKGLTVKDTTVKAAPEIGS